MSNSEMTPHQAISLVRNMAVPPARMDPRRFEDALRVLASFVELHTPPAGPSNPNYANLVGPVSYEVWNPHSDGFAPSKVGVKLTYDSPDGYRYEARANRARSQHLNKQLALHALNKAVGKRDFVGRTPGREESTPTKAQLDQIEAKLDALLATKHRPHPL